MTQSDPEDLSDLLQGVVRPRHGVSHSPPVREDLVVIPARARFVSEEMYLLVAVILHKLETVSLVPALGEAVYRDLAAHGKLETLT